MGKKFLAIVIVLLLTLGEVGNISADTTNSSSSAIGVISSNSTNMEVDSSNSINDKNVKVSKEEAKKISIELLKKYFGLEIDEKKYQGTVQLVPDYEIEKGYSWQLDWHTNSSNIYTYISTQICASTGKLLSFYGSKSYSSQQPVEVAAITKEQACKLADEFVKKVNPEEFKQMKLEEKSSDAIYFSRVRPNYNFNYIREINGLSYPGNFITVGINGTNGSITSYRTNWEYDVSFPAVQGLLEKDKALDIFRKETSMDLYYVPMRNLVARYMIPSTVKLAYFPKTSGGTTMDAQTGEFIDNNGEKVGSVKTRDITKEQKTTLMASKPEPSEETSEMSSEKAEAFINVLVKEFFGAGYKAENLSYSENDMGLSGQNGEYWNAEIMEDKPEAAEGKGSVSIDNSTGEVMNIGRYIFEDWYGKEYERKLTWEQAYDKAIEVLGRYYPHRLGDIRTEQVCTENLYPVNGKLVPDRMIYFSFPRLINGIPYNNDAINISIDTKTGEINNLNFSWSTNISFPAAEGAMDKEKAKEIFFKEYDIKPIYSRYTKKTEDNKPLTYYKIVYVLEQKQGGNISRNIEAFTGKFLNQYGEEIEAMESSFSEIIKGHPSEKELGILAFQGIIDTKSFIPDRETTYMELIRMLVSAKGYRPYIARDQEELLFKNVDKKDVNYSYLLEAVRYGIIENKPIDLKLDAKVTREQMAGLIVKLLGYEKLAKVKDIFVLDFKDSDMISGELKGHVAIVKGLGIIDKGGEMFRPKENLKMHEAALIIYKALDSMREMK